MITFSEEKLIKSNPPKANRPVISGVDPVVVITSFAR